LPLQGVPLPPLIRNEGGNILSRQHTPVVEAEAAETLESTRSVSQSHPRVFHPPSGVRLRPSGKQPEGLDLLLLFFLLFQFRYRFHPLCLPMISQSHPPSLPLLRKLPRASGDEGHHWWVGSHGSESLQRPPHATCCRHRLYLHPRLGTHPSGVPFFCSLLALQLKSDISGLVCFGPERVPFHMEQFSPV
jgi:hypothetical protein